MKLGKGINYSRYCLWWEGTNDNNTNYMLPDNTNIRRDKISPNKLAETAEHISLIKNLGFDTVRLPISFNVWTTLDTTDITNHQYWIVIDNMLSLCAKHGLNLVIDYHHAILDEKTLTDNKLRILSFWEQIAIRLKDTDVNKVLFEIYNEPIDPRLVEDGIIGISTPDLVSFYQEIVAVIRSTGKKNFNRKIVVGGNGFYDIGFQDVGLLSFLKSEPFPDDLNIIYTFHFYEPKFFTMQGLDDGDVNFPVEKVEFPAVKDYTGTNILKSVDGDFYDSNYFEAQDADILALNIDGKGMGSIEFIQAAINQLKVFTDKGIQIWCSEIGIYRFFADQVQNSNSPELHASIERYANKLLKGLNDNKIEWCWWDFEGSMSIFNPVPRVQLGRPEFPSLNRPNDSPDLGNAFGFALPYKKEKIDPLMRKLLGLNSDYGFKMSDRIIRSKDIFKKSTIHRLFFSWSPVDEIDVLKYEVIGHHVTFKIGKPPFSTPIPQFQPFVLITKNKGNVPYATSLTTNNSFELMPSVYLLRVHKTDSTFVDISVE
jgi:endoglucanase